MNLPTYLTLLVVLVFMSVKVIYLFTLYPVIPDVQQRVDPVLRRGHVHGDLLPHHSHGGGIYAQRYVLHI